jgi:hypothetical protein
MKMSERTPSELNPRDEDEEDGESSDDENQNVFYKSKELIFEPKSVQRKWLRSHGKSKFIDFDEKQMEILKTVFKDLDDDGGESIGVDELEDPLIALGLVNDRAQVEKMVLEIDDDANIEFEEFLQLVKGKNKQKAMPSAGKTDSDLLFDFFKKLTNQELQQKGKE